MCSYDMIIVTPDVTYFFHEHLKAVMFWYRGYINIC